MRGAGGSVPAEMSSTIFPFFTPPAPSALTNKKASQLDPKGLKPKTSVIPHE